MKGVEMRILLIGGTGTISTAITALLADRGKDEVWVLNRGNRASSLPAGVHQLVGRCGAYVHELTNMALKDIGDNLHLEYVKTYEVGSDIEAVLEIRPKRLLQGCWVMGIAHQLMHTGRKA